MATLNYANTKVQKLYYQNTEVKKCYYQNVLVLDNSFPDPEGALGDVITWDDKEWLVCHIDYDNNVKYLIYKNIFQLGEWSWNSTHYSDSYNVGRCNDFQNRMSAAALNMCVDVTVPSDGYWGTKYDVTSKVFTPSYTQMNGGFSWFYRDINRIAYFQGSATDYWTSSTSSLNNVWTVRSYGTIHSVDTYSEGTGFRPCIAVQCKNPIPIPPPFPAPSSHTPGDVITWDDKEWLVCHYDSANNQVYLIAKDVISKTQFGRSIITYTGSYLAGVAASYQTNKMSADALAMCVDVTVPGLGYRYDVTSKVFVPSYEQFNGGFSWFNSNDHRKARYNGTSTYLSYWTSSAYLGGGSLWTVNSDGSLLNRLGPDNTMGFRPCVCVQL